MNTVLFNHPYRDSCTGSIVTPIRIQSKDLVIFKYQGEDTENVMTVESWKRYCVPIIFDSEEGA